MKRKHLQIVGFVGRSKITWDTIPPRDLRQGEEAIILDCYDDCRGHADDAYPTLFSVWTLLNVTRPRLVRLTMPWSVDLLRYFEV